MTDIKQATECDVPHGAEVAASYDGKTLPAKIISSPGEDTSVGNPTPNIVSEGSAEVGSEEPFNNDLFPGGENVIDQPPQNEETIIAESSQPSLAMVSSIGGGAPNLALPGVPVSGLSITAGADFFQTAISNFLGDAESYIASARATNVALYRLLEKVAQFRVDERFDLVNFCKAAGYPCKNPEHKNKSLVILKAITFKAGTEMPDKTASKYGKVVEWLVQQCPDSASVVSYLAEHGGIEGVDKLRSPAIAPPDGGNGRTSVNHHVGDADNHHESDELGDHVKDARVINVPEDLPEGTEIIAVLEKMGIWKYKSVIPDA